MYTKSFIEDLLKVKLILMNQIKPSEEHSIEMVSSLLDNVINENVWTHPILIENKNFVIMDGHHRYQVAKKLNFKRIPCIIIGYDNPYLRVKSRIDGANIYIRDIINAGLSGQLLKFKSTQHELLFDLIKTQIPIQVLSNKYE